MTLNQFEQQYSNYLSEELNTLKDIQKQCKADSRDDEAKFAVIEANIVEIFTKMFAISIQQSKTADNWKTALSEAYTHFFVKIPTPWLEQLAKCESHQLEEEAHIERIKLARANVIREQFEAMLLEV